MARINIEDRLWEDPRFEMLAAKIGEDMALAQLIKLWKLGQKYWVMKRLIPDEVYRSKRFPKALEESEFVVKRDNGYYVKGAKSRFAWIFQKIEAGKKSGETRKRKHKENQPSDLNVRSNIRSNKRSNGSRTGDEPPSPPPLPSPIPPPSPERTTEEQNKYVSGDLASLGAPTPVPKPNEKLGSLIWESYRGAYVKRHGSEPVRNGMVNGQIAQLIKRLGREAIDVVAFYVAHNGQFYVRQMHPIGLCLKDAESLRTQWATGRVMTGAEARSAEGRDFHREQMRRIMEEKS